MAVEMIGGPRLCEPLLATGLGRFTGAASRHANVPLLTDDSQIGANLRVCVDEEDRADFDQRS